MAEDKEFLTNLVGSWDLSGQMGATPLRQTVECRWALSGLYLEMRFKSTLLAPDGQLPYEAVYFIGYNKPSDRYIMHLLDTSGVPDRCIAGVGQLEGDTIAFLFDYDEGPFTNRFIWDAEGQGWRFELTYLQDEREQIFAVKEMRRL